jgi:anaerobic magnesium-protoporphyrin IX monomethyl ester cyclase
MKILLNLCYTMELSKAQNCAYPLGLLSLAAYVQKRIEGIEVKIIDGLMDIGDIEAFRPDIIGISLLSPFFTTGCRQAAKIKEKFPDIPILFGGHHITYIPNNLPKECAAGVLGEGEEIFYQICGLMHKEGRLDARDLKKIKGIVYWDNGVLKHNERGDDTLADDQLPQIDNYDLCTFKNTRGFYYHLIASRGCPYQCRFCSSSPFWKKVRYHSVKNVVNQIEYIINRFHPQHINFYDDLMIANKTYLRALHDEIIEKKLHQRQTDFTCWAAGRHFDDEAATLLREINCVHVSFGVESGSPAVYRYLKGNWNSPEKNAEAIKRAHSFGFKVNVSVIVGTPIETTSDLQQNIDYLKSLPIDSGSVGLLKAFPGTQLWEDAKSRNLVNDSMPDWGAIESDEIMNPATIFLGEKTSRKETYRMYIKINRLLKRKKSISILKSRAKKIFIPKYWLIILRRRGLLRSTANVQ